MLFDKYGRKIDYLRVSVTGSCNYLCEYCFPRDARMDYAASQISSNEMIGVILEAGRLGITKLKFTGGEPLMNGELEYIIYSLSRSGLFRDIGMTTNGSLLTDKKARGLKRAGLQRVNISLDTTDAARFSRITGGGEIEDALRGIDAAIEARLTPVKINMVIMSDTHPDEISLMRRFCSSKGLVLQTISQFSIGKRWKDCEVPADRPLPCKMCNRIRFTADGFLKPCLRSDEEIRVDFADIERSITEAVWCKPRAGGCCKNRTMSQTGG